MRDLLGMSLTAIRQELLIASPEQIETYASRAAVLTPEPDEVATKESGTRGDQASVLDYLRDLRARGAPTPRTDVAQSSGFAALEQRLAHARASSSARPARGEDWLRVSITPDVELTIRGPLDAEQRAQIERCADLIRDILQGRSK